MYAAPASPLSRDRQPYLIVGLAGRGQTKAKYAIEGRIAASQLFPMRYARCRRGTHKTFRSFNQTPTSLQEKGLYGWQHLPGLCSVTRKASIAVNYQR